MRWSVQKIRNIGASLALVVMVALALSPAHAAAGDDDMLGAASDSHLWIVLEPSKQQTVFDLVHHPAGEAGEHFRIQHSMTQAPAAIAAWDDRLWLVQSPRSAGGQWQREVYSTAAAQNPATGLYYTIPAGRLEMMPVLSGLGTLAGFVGTRQGPVALLLPSQRAGVSITAGAQSAASEPFLAQPQLLRLAPGAAAWSEITLPKGFDGSHVTLLAAGGADGDELVLLAAAADNPARSNGYFRQRDGTWIVVSLAIDARRVRSLLSVAGQVLAVSVARGDEQISLAYLRPGGVLPLTSIDRVEGRWAALPHADEIMIVQRERGGGDPRLTIRTIDPLSGRVDRPQPFTRQPITAGRLWQVVVILGLSISAVLAVVLVRPAPTSAIAIDPSHCLPLSRRMAAAAIDFVIGAVPVMLILGCVPSDFMTLPVFAADLARSGPYALAAVLASVVATAAEVLTGRSVGKALFGGRIASVDDSTPSRWRIALRGVIRLFVWFIPPLGLLIISNSHMQGLPDIAARTLVLRSADEPPPEDT